jgi:hypothetical protein
MKKSGTRPSAARVDVGGCADIVMGREVYRAATIPFRFRDRVLFATAS